MTPEEILEGAARVLSEKGHTKGGLFYDAETGGYCALGALGEASGLIEHEAQTPHWIAAAFRDKAFESAAIRLANAAGLPNHHYIPNWNDDKASAEDVILAMKKAAHRDS